MQKHCRQHPHKNDNCPIDRVFHQTYVDKIIHWILTLERIFADTVLNGGGHRTNREISNGSHQKNSDPIGQVPADIIGVHNSAFKWQRALVAMRSVSCQRYRLDEDRVTIELKRYCQRHTKRYGNPASVCELFYLEEETATIFCDRRRHSNGMMRIDLLR